MSEIEFPPFVPAKPKGGVAAEIAAAQPPRVTVPAEKQRRKRRTKEEMAAAFAPNGSTPIPVDSFAVYAKIVGLLEPVPQKIRIEIVRMLMDHHT